MKNLHLTNLATSIQDHGVRDLVKKTWWISAPVTMTKAPIMSYVLLVLPHDISAGSKSKKPHATHAKAR